MDSFQVSEGRKGRSNEKYGYDPCSLVDIECARSVKVHQKMKRWYSKENVLDDKNRQFHQSVNFLTENRLDASNMDDICSLGVPNGKVDSEISNAECELSSPLVQRKRRRKLMHEGNSVALF